MAELDCALRLLPLGSAPGPDMIHGEALRHLGPCAKHSALTLFSKSLRTGIVPQSRRHGIIILLLETSMRLLSCPALKGLRCHFGVDGGDMEKLCFMQKLAKFLLAVER
ncbi:hypothetical protein DQ04_13411000, partial [Trypanosoma grayi]|uniref:hypothetical protein n=1 Tax=Trypanosoma grayi TaxID=71804 RepID=UPI0004F4B74C